MLALTALSRQLRPLGLAVALALFATGSAEAQAPAPGFQVDLGARDARHVECFVSGGALSCLDYSRAAAPGRCDFGGDVPTVRLRSRGRAVITYTCVDEGFHGWKRLRGGQVFRSGPFRCRVNERRDALRCTSTRSGWWFRVHASGRVTRGR